MKLGIYHGAALMLAGSLAAAAVAQTVRDPAPTAPSASLNIPANPQFLTEEDPNVRKATAIVNGTVITRTEVDHRLAIIRMAAGGQIPPEELPRLRQQVLRNLVDEVLQIQAAEQADIKITKAEVDQYFARYAQSQFKMTADQMGNFLRSNGASPETLKRQIHGEMAWARLQSRKIEPFVNISEDEVQAVIERLNAAKGTQEFKVSEIFLSATPETAAETRANAERIVQQLRGGASFLAYARQFSEASTAAVGGDLGWVRSAQLPEALAAAVQAMPVGSVSDPIAIPGGFSIIQVADTRQVLTADPRDAVLSLKQMTIRFAPGSPKNVIQEKVQGLLRAVQTMGGCGGAEAAAAPIGAEVVTNDQVKVRDLPPALQQTLLALGLGQATPAFGSDDDRVSVLVLCGRDDPDPAGNVSFEQIYNQIAENRVNLRARRFLRDLRRDAVVDYR
ncbi:MAG TPA: peptidylprolyl isomerase [Allosphingosinicella sp.]|jgi:peptidyl-prolyl cis-trans isomerase SurA|nr:peptidylprolyl isomerase [Allosphingosinicella sp.]